jgi:GNAT superfamily N-acetyltransferase
MSEQIDALRIAHVDAETVRPLRLSMLRHGRPANDAVFEGDDHPRIAHVAAFDADGEVVAVGTVFPEAAPWAPDETGAWRIRGMATAEGWRSHGIGGRVLDALLAHAREGGGTVIWCHAREGAWAFYERAGFAALGESFDDGLAVHRSMWRSL